MAKRFKCKECDKQIQETICLDCLEGKISSTKNEPKKSFIIPELARAFLQVIISVLVLLIGVKFVAPPNLPDVDGFVAFNSGKPIKIDSQFDCDFQVDEQPWINFSIQNSGQTCAENLDVQINFKKAKIKTVAPTYNPITISEKIKKSTGKEGERVFFEKFSSFPANCSVNYKIFLDSFIESSGDFSWTLCSKEVNWTENVELKLYENSFSFLSSPFISKAYASVSPDKKGEEKKSSIGYLRVKMAFLPKDGVYLSGYNPIIITNGIFLLLQDKKVLSHESADTIRTIVNGTKEGVLFGGVNVLKFCELILNFLINKKYINLAQAQEILKKAKTSGGVLIGGFNPIVLQIEILNVLLKSKLISREEGQFIINYARPPKNKSKE